MCRAETVKKASDQTVFLTTSEVSLSKTLPPKKSPISNGMIGITIFIVTEVMFFAALISAYIVIRSGQDEWPPWGQPRLPVETTALKDASANEENVLNENANASFNLPQENEASIYARMEAERKRQANKFRSEGEEEAQKINGASLSLALKELEQNSLEKTISPYIQKGALIV